MTVEMPSQLPPLKLNQDLQAHLQQFFDRQQLNAISAALGTPPLVTYCRVNTLLYSRSEARRALQDVVDKYCEKRGWESMCVEEHPTLSDILFIRTAVKSISDGCERGMVERSSSSDTSGSEDVEHKSCEVVVDIKCAKSVLRGANVFACGIMGASSNLWPRQKVRVYGAVKKPTRGAMGPFSTDSTNTYLGMGVSLVSRDDLFTKPPTALSGVGVEMTDPLYRFPAFGDMLGKELFLQNIASSVVGYVLAAQEGELVLDMCCCPGGKSTHVAQLTRNKATIVSCDRTAKKVLSFLADLRASNMYPSIHPFVADSRTLVDLGHTPDTRTFTLPERGTKLDTNFFPRESFDRIILDPPCSGIGQRPHLLGNDFASNATHNLGTYPSYQRQLFETSYHLLKKGGRLTFSTCTINPSENERAVLWALRTFPDLKLLNIWDMDFMQGFGGCFGCGIPLVDAPPKWEMQRRMVVRALPGLKCVDGRWIPDHHGLEDEAEECDVRHEDTIGFFVACFEKI